VDALEAKWQALQDKAAPTTDDAKADLQKAKDQITQTLADAKAKLVQAKDATDDVWQNDIKPALKAALDKAQKLYDDAAAEFGSKQAT
jgi:predicted  nucleic acid-binding Zn-ribbon protein